MDLTTRPSSLTLTRAGTAAPKKQSRFGAVVEWEGQTEAGEKYGLFLFLFFFFGYRKEILLPNRKEYVIFPPKCAQC